MSRGSQITIVALSGTVFIDRANRSSALATFDNAVKQMKKNKVSIFGLD
jgi:lysophosphatidate acyltransferase